MSSFTEQSAPVGCSIVICANKVDLPLEKWQVSRETFTAYAQSAGYTLLETSASSGRNTNEVNACPCMQIMSSFYIYI